MKNLAEQLTLEFGKGFDESNLSNMNILSGISNSWRIASRIELDPLSFVKQVGFRGKESLLFKGAYRQ